MGRPSISSKVKHAETKAAKDPLRTTRFGTLGKQSQPRKKHAEYREHSLRSGTIKCLEYGRHDAAQIVLEAFNTFSSGWSKEQRAASDRFKEAYVGWEKSMGKTEVMMRMIEAFSKMFFLGKLDSVRLEWNSEMAEYGKCSVSYINGLQGCITLSRRDYHIETRDRNRLGSYTGTLLHELCHAFVRLYSCSGECRQFQCVAGQSIARGETGHARAWFLLATAVQTVFRREFPELDIRLGIYDAMIKENKRSRYVPDDEDWDFLLKNSKFGKHEMRDFFTELSEDGWRMLKAAYDRESRVFDRLRNEWEELQKGVAAEQGLASSGSDKAPPNVCSENALSAGRSKGILQNLRGLLWPFL